AAKAMEAVVGLAAELGMPNAFAPRAQATLIVKAQHIRFLREAHVGAQLHIDAGVLEMGEDDAHVLFLMRHVGGQLAASFQMQLSHVTAREGRAFPWPDWARARAERLKIDMPEKAQPRSLAFEPGAESRASLERALDLGLKRIGMGAIRPANCDAFGRMATETVMARISDSVAHLMADRLAAHPGERIGAVALEYRFRYLD